MTTIGKYRHLSHCANEKGHFVISAIDHRTNLQEKLTQSAAPQPFTDADFLTFKSEILRAVSPYSSGVLADPAFGIWTGIISGNIRGDMGLLAPVEVTDYGLHPSERNMEMIPYWSVKKVKMIGGDGIKMLLPYNPNAENTDEKNETVQQIIDDCATYDIPFFLEPIPYALDPAVKLSNSELLEISIEMCERFSAMGVDVLKLPFPVDHKQSSDLSEWRSACEAIDKACSVPWALLSAGVTFETFVTQSRIACQAGASGVIVGRALWSEAVELQGHERSDFLATTSAQRMQELAQVCDEYAQPFYKRVELPDLSINWYESYQE